MLKLPAPACGVADMHLCCLHLCCLHLCCLHRCPSSSIPCILGIPCIAPPCMPSSSLAFEPIMEARREATPVCSAMVLLLSLELREPREPVGAVREGD